VATRVRACLGRLSGFPRRSTGTVDYGADPCGGNGRILMLPDSYDGPAGVGQDPVMASITFYVPGQFRTPVLAINLGRPPVFWTAVPETSVDEDGDACPGEDKIRAHSPSRKVEAHVNPVPAPGRM
jgi:hypothetical protein